MHANQHEEHLACQPDNSRWDGFDRGDVDQSGDDDMTLAANEELLAEMRAEVLSALRAFVRQRPGLEFGNYGDVQAYRAEVRSITKDMHHAEELIRAVELRSIDGDAIIKAATSRLSIEATDKGVRVDWCTGQYWPTEYRRGVAGVLSSVLWDYWRDQCKCDTGDKIRAEARRSLSRAVARRFFR